MCSCGLMLKTCNQKVAGSSLRCGRDCRLGSECTALSSTLKTMTEVRPLSKTLNPQLLPGCHSNKAVHCSGCVCVCVHLDELNAEHIFSKYGAPYLATRHFTFTFLTWWQRYFWFSVCQVLLPSPPAHSTDLAALSPSLLHHSPQPWPAHTSCTRLAWDLKYALK